MIDFHEFLEIMHSFEKDPYETIGSAENKNINESSIIDEKNKINELSINKQKNNSIESSINGGNKINELSIKNEKNESSVLLIDKKQVNSIKNLLKAFNEVGEDTGETIVKLGACDYLISMLFTCVTSRNYKELLKNEEGVNIEVIDPNVKITPEDVLENISHCDYKFLLQFFVNFDYFVKLFDNNKQNNSKPFLSNCTNIDEYNSILPVIKMVIRLLAKVLYNKSEILYSRSDFNKECLSDKMMKEVIMPIICDTKCISTYFDEENYSDDISSKNLPIEKMKELFNNDQVIKKIKKELDMDNLVFYAVNNDPVVKSSIRRFGKRIFERTSNKDKESDKIVIKSDYISNIINDYTGDNRVAKVGRYLTKPE